MPRIKDMPSLYWHDIKVAKCLKQSSLKSKNRTSNFEWPVTLALYKNGMALCGGFYIASRNRL